MWATSSLCGLALLQGGVEGMMDSAAVLSVSVSESNSPCEDRHAIKHQAVSGDAQASCYGIFDGHGGTLAVEIAAVLTERGLGGEQAIEKSRVLAGVGNRCVHVFIVLANRRMRRWVFQAGGCG